MSENKHKHCHEHEHHHEHHHEHDHHSPAHIHSHRNIIGFDEHGIPTVILKASHGEGEADDPQAFIRDYMNAVTEYKKTFPSKQDDIDQTPDPAVREMLLRMDAVSFSREIASKAVHVDLGGNPLFNELFVEHMLFEE